jgi:phosphatidylserine/phosphatidylglycerophosphate/cardiolipin synthase-like enzyme
MRRKACVAVVWLSGLAATLHAHAADTFSQPVAAQGSLQAAFAPWDNIEELVTDAIGGARKQRLVQAYLLTSKKIKIANTLIQAQRRGIDVRVLADAEQIGRAATRRVPDLAATVIAGSYNFTWTAQHKNAENVLIVRKNHAFAAHYGIELGEAPSGCGVV